MVSAVSANNTLFRESYEMEKHVRKEIGKVRIKLKFGPTPNMAICVDDPIATPREIS